MAVEKTTILLVEDDDVDRELIHRLLDNEFEIIDAVTGEKGLKKLETFTPQCVLLDYRLPDYTGLELVPAILKKCIAVVMLTAAGSERIAVEALRAGCHDYLVKGDLTKERLRRVVEHAVDSNNLDKQRHELESYVATSGQDLKAPLRAIRGYTEIAEMSIERGEWKELSQFLETIQKSASELTGVVEAITELVSLEERQLLADEEIDLNKIADSLCDKFAEDLNEAGGKLEFESLPTVSGDGELLRKLLESLISNAIKYRGEKPVSIHIEAKKVGSDQQISVADRGIGIAPEFHDQIFKPLRRLRSASKVTGDGIGLAVAQKIADLHGGRIWVESTEGNGAIFRFTLP